MTTEESMRLYFGSKNDDVETPFSLKRQLEIEFGMDLYDPCPINCTTNNLLVPWKKRNYVNPPFSNVTGFVEKAIKEYHMFGNETLLLVPFRPTTKYWNDYLWPNIKEFYVFKKNIVFAGYDRGLPIPIVLVLIGEWKDRKTFTKNQNLNWPYEKVTLK